MDFNGDGKSDLLIIKNNTSEIFTFDSFTARSLYSSTSFPTKNHLLYFGDFNGDRKTDILARSSLTDNAASWSQAISKGKGFDVNTFSFSHAPNMNFNGNFSSGDQLNLADLNGDGKTDISLAWYTGGSSSTTIDLYYSRGNSFYSRQETYPQMLGFVSTPLDLNGDGKTDILYQAYYQSPVTIFYFNNDSKSQYLHKVKDGFGHVTEFNYQKLTDGVGFYNQGSLTNYPVNNVRPSLYAISELKKQDGIGGNVTSQFFYEEAKLHRAGKGFLGFKKITTNNQTTGFKLISESQFNTDYYTLAPYKESTYSTSNNSLVSETTLSSSFSNKGNKRFFLKVNSSSVYQAIEGQTITTTSTYDDYGNITDNTVNNNNVETIQTATEYGSYNTGIPNRPTLVTVTKTRSGQNSYQTKTRLQYTDKGQISSKTDFYGQAKSVTTSYGYHALGYINTTTMSPAGMNQRTSSAYYDGKGRYPENTTNTLGQTAYASYDSRWGKPLTETGIDGLTTSYEYDAFGRTKKTNFPEGYSVQQSYSWDFSDGAVYYTLLTHPAKPDVKTWFDVLGREIRKQTEGMNNQWISQQQTYDSRGNVSSSTQPYLPGENILTTFSSFDEYKRPTSSGNTAFGNTTVSYSYNNGNSTVTTTNPAGQISSKTTDASGQVITATDNGGSLNYTYYSHGGLRELKKDGTTLSSHEYDEYARQTNLTDSNAGVTSYDYNALGELTTQTNANGQTHTLQYDNLERITSRSGPEGTTTTEYYGSNQGTSTNQLKKVTGFAGNTTEYTYDDKGRVNGIKQTVDGNAYTTTLVYNTYGDVTSKSYSTGFGTNHNYDSNGYLTSIKNSNNSVTIYSIGSLNGLGQVKSYNLGNNKSSQIDYYYGTPTHFSTGGVQDLNLSWNYQSGNLNYRQDGIKNKKENFNYDNLNRLTSFQVEGQSAVSMNYASSGNINSKTDAGTYTYLGSKSNAVEYISNPQGVISSQKQEISYTAFMQPQVLKENGYELTYTYGADYERYKGVLKQNGNPLWTRYYLGDFEKNNNQAIHYIQSPAGLVAIVVRENNNDTYYYTYTDHLGSLLAVTDNNGTVVAEQNFDPWGRRRSPGNWDYNNVPVPPSWLYRGYTGHEMLDPFVLINMNGRIYDPVAGRVLSPDNIVADPFDTQSFNRYTYAFNNPLVYNDPDGNCPICIAIGVGALFGYFSGKAQGATGWDLVGYTFAGAAIGGLSAGIGQAVLGSFSLGAQGGIFASSIGAYAASGAASGFIGGGGFSVLGGGSFWDGAIKGAAVGGVTGALTGLLKYNSFINSLTNPDNLFAQPKPAINGGTLPGVTVRAPRLSQGFSQVRQNYLSVADYLEEIRYATPPLATGAVTPVYWEQNFIPLLPKGMFNIPRLGAGSIRGGANYGEGSFSIFNWNGYPAGGLQPTGPFRLLEGAEYTTARNLANSTNAAMRRANPQMFRGLQIHEIHPVKFGGSPTALTNKIFLTPAQHAQYTTFWNAVMRSTK